MVLECRTQIDRSSKDSTSILTTSESHSMTVKDRSMVSRKHVSGSSAEAFGDEI